MPWRFLEQYKGKYFNTEWPSLPQMFDIITERFPDNRCFEAFTPKHITFTYTEANKAIVDERGGMLIVGFGYKLTKVTYTK